MHYLSIYSRHSRFEIVASGPISEQGGWGWGEEAGWRGGGGGDSIFIVPGKIIQLRDFQKF